MTTPTTIELLGPGRHVCPKCHGGSDGEKSLSVSVDELGGHHWRCFRGMCGYTGGHRGRSNLFAENKKEPRYFTRPIKPVNIEQHSLIRAKFDIDPNDIDGYSYWDDRFILGVRGPKGYVRRGCVAYSLSGLTPKSLTYNERPNEPFLHWTGARRVDGPTDIVIVEDWFSAEKVASTEAVQAVALFGTHLTQADVTEIAEVAKNLGGKVHIALDRDAFAKSLYYRDEYGEQFPNGLGVWMLEKDLKYVSKERIKEAIVNGKVDFIRDAQGAENV